MNITLELPSLPLSPLFVCVLASGQARTPTCHRHHGAAGRVTWSESRAGMREFIFPPHTALGRPLGNKKSSNKSSCACCGSNNSSRWRGKFALTPAPGMPWLGAGQIPCTIPTAGLGNVGDSQSCAKAWEASFLLNSLLR